MFLVVCHVAISCVDHDIWAIEQGRWPFLFAYPACGRKPQRSVIPPPSGVRLSVDNVSIALYPEQPSVRLYVTGLPPSSHRQCVPASLGGVVNPPRVPASVFVHTGLTILGWGFRSPDSFV